MFSGLQSLKKYVKSYLLECNFSYYIFGLGLLIATQHKWESLRGTTWPRPPHNLFYIYENTAITAERVIIPTCKQCRWNASGQDREGSQPRKIWTSPQRTPARPPCCRCGTSGRRPSWSSTPTTTSTLSTSERSSSATTPWAAILTRQRASLVSKA